MADTRYEALRGAIHEYGAAAFQNLMKCRALGDAIVEGFAAYEGCDRACVSAVPAQGQFDPRKDYGDEAYSFSKRQVIVLEPINFGVSLIVGNAEDAGALWLRTVVSAEIVGDSFDIYVAARPKLRAPIAFDGALEPVWAAIHQEFIDTFAREVLEFNDERFKTGIGFLPV